MDNVGNFKLNGEMVFNSERGQANVKALLDIEGDCFTRRRLNAGFSTGNDTLGIDKFPFNILYDTRTSIVKDNNNSIGLVSNVNVWNRGVGGTATRWYTNGPISGTINYHTTEGAISLYTSSTYSENTNHDQAVQLEGFKISFWIKLQNEHSTYSTKTLVGVGTLATSGVTGCRVQITSDRIQMNFGDYQIYPSTAYTFTANNWYHIWVQSDPVDNAGLTNSLIKINDVSLTLSSSGTISNKGSNYDKKFYVGSNISGDSAINIYIGNIAFYPKISAEYYGSPENPTSTDMYNWGPPEQKLVVGGQAYIQSSLGINKFIPSYELDVAGDINCTGALSKGSGSFKIEHPLPNMSNTHYLYHSFIEGPQADLIYRGSVDLVNGSASINLDTVSKMTNGTFEVLNRNVQCFTTNETDWDAVKGSVSGNILTISCQNTSSSANISWLVIGERKDQHMYDTEWTDEQGYVVPEKLK